MTDETEPAAESPQPDPPATTPPVAAPRPMTDVDRKNWAMAAHLSALIAIIGIPSLIGPLVVWLIKKDQDEFVRRHSVLALNFNISVLIYVTVASIAMLILGVATFGIGFLLAIPVVIVALILWLVYVIQAAMAASKGQEFKYPLTIDLIK